jgi:GH25 family lysozyme M1 (1,4-beta-N-acetylmuramidase)
MKIKAIDVSKHQGTIDWSKVKNAGVELAILRCGYGSDITSQDDQMFETNYSGAKKAGIKVGVYLYSYAKSVTDAKSEAEHVVRLLKGKTLDYPVYYDLEDSNTTGKCSALVIGDMATVFCDAVKAAGYKVGIYANKYWFTSILTDSRFNGWDKWVAQYYSECTYQGKYTAWQYTSTGKVDGISGNVDMSEFYVDYTASATTTQTVAAQTISTVSASTLPDLTGYTGTSIAGALNSKGYDSSFAYRKTLAEKLGISNYTGTAAQNLEMIVKLGGKVTAEKEKETVVSYTIRKGDTLSSIAKQFKTTVNALAQYNRIADVNKIYVGQTIKIPG